MTNYVHLVEQIERWRADTKEQVTFVTFLLNGTSSTIGFCGDQRGLFPIDQNVRTDFTLGQPCDSIIVVVIIV